MNEDNFWYRRDEIRWQKRDKKKCWMKLATSEGGMKDVGTEWMKERYCMMITVL